MNFEELYKKLQELGIKDEKFYIMGIYGSDNDNEKLSIIQKKTTDGVIYEIYFKEKNEKNIIRVFNNKEEAFNFFIDSLLFDKMMEEKYSNKLNK